jgi:hypothetical protein
MLQLYAKLWAPVFDNPWLTWCIDAYVDLALRVYYWPIQAGLDLQEIRDFIQSTSICKPSRPREDKAD